MYQILIYQKGHRWLWAIFKNDTVVGKATASYPNPTQASDYACAFYHRLTLPHDPNDVPRKK